MNVPFFIVLDGLNKLPELMVKKNAFCTTHEKSQTSLEQLFPVEGAISIESFGTIQKLHGSNSEK